MGKVRTVAERSVHSSSAMQSFKLLLNTLRRFRTGNRADRSVGCDCRKVLLTILPALVDASKGESQVAPSSPTETGCSIGRSNSEVVVVARETPADTIGLPPGSVGEDGKLCSQPSSREDS